MEHTAAESDAAAGLPGAIKSHNWAHVEPKLQMVVAHARSLGASKLGLLVCSCVACAYQRGCMPACRRVCVSTGVTARS